MASMPLPAMLFCCLTKLCVLYPHNLELYSLQTKCEQILLYVRDIMVGRENSGHGINLFGTFIGLISHRIFTNLAWFDLQVVASWTHIWKPHWPLSASRLQWLRPQSAHGGTHPCNSSQTTSQKTSSASLFSAKITSVQMVRIICLKKLD